jgi:hypothetical protein
MADNIKMDLWNRFSKYGIVELIQATRSSVPEDVYFKHGKEHFRSLEILTKPGTYAFIVSSVFQS